MTGFYSNVSEKIVNGFNEFIFQSHVTYFNHLLGLHMQIEYQLPSSSQSQQESAESFHG